MYSCHSLSHHLGCCFYSDIKIATEGDTLQLEVTYDSYSETEVTGSGG